MHYRFTLLVLCVLILAAGCRRSAPVPVQPEWRPIAPVARIFYDNSGGVRDSLRLVIRDESQLKSLWDQVTSTRSDPPPVPAVDFGREMVLVVAAGRMIAEDEIRVDSVTVREDRTADGRTEEVLAAMVRTIIGCRRFDIEAYPVEMVRVQRFPGTVKFVEIREQAICAPEQ
jgi:hypothetical protein